MSVVAAWWNRRKPSRLFVFLERRILGLVMSLVAWVVERLLLRAMKRAPLPAAPRTAAESEALGEDLGAAPAGAVSDLS